MKKRRREEEGKRRRGETLMNVIITERFRAIDKPD